MSISEEQLQDLLTEATQQEPPMAIDIDRVVTLGETKLRRRRASVAGGVLATAATIAAVAWLQPWEGWTAAEVIPAVDVTWEAEEDVEVVITDHTFRSDDPDRQIVLERAAGAERSQIWVVTDDGRAELSGAEHSLGFEVFTGEGITVMVAATEPGWNYFRLAAESPGVATTSDRTQVGDDLLEWHLIDTEGGLGLYDDLLVIGGEDLLTVSGVPVEQAEIGGSDRARDSTVVYVIPDRETWGLLSLRPGYESYMGNSQRIGAGQNLMHTWADVGFEDQEDVVAGQAVGVVPLTATGVVFTGTDGVRLPVEVIDLETTAIAVATQIKEDAYDDWSLHGQFTWEEGDID